MADTNTYISKQKVEKWTTREKFNALGDLRDIEPGTEYNLAGAIEESDLDSDLQTKINGKLTKPTNPSAESAVTMLADGTVGTKPLGEIGGGGKSYLHKICFSYNSGNIFFSIINTTNDTITLNLLKSVYLTEPITCTYIGERGDSTCFFMYEGGFQIKSIIVPSGNNSFTLHNDFVLDGDVVAYRDTITQL